MKYITPDWAAPSNVKAYTTTRIGYPISHPYDAARLSEASESHRLISLLHLPAKPIWLKQEHTNIAVEAKETTLGCVADASYTANAKHICMVFTADCLPLLVCNQSGTHVAAIHAGWRGLANGVIENTIRALNQPAESLLVWLGPAIGPEKFEVGKEVYDAFISAHKEAEQAFQPLENNKWMANLYTLAKIRLNSLGVNAITGGNCCTFTQKDLFYSYRRDQGQTGRMASLIWLE